MNPILRNFIEDHERNRDETEATTDKRRKIIFPDILEQKRDTPLTDDFPSKKEYLNIHGIQPDREYFSGPKERLEEKYMDFFRKFFSDKKPNIVECSYEQLNVVYELIEKKIWPGIWCVICHVLSSTIDDLRNDLIPFFILLAPREKKFDYIDYRDENLKTIIYSTAISLKHGKEKKALSRNKKVGEIHFSTTYPITTDIPSPDTYTSPADFAERFGKQNQQIKFKDRAILVKFSEKSSRNFGDAQIISMIAGEEKIILKDEEKKPKVYFIHGTFNSDNMIEIEKSERNKYEENRAKNIGLVFVDIKDNFGISRLIDTSNPENLTADYFCSDTSLFPESIFEPFRKKYFEEGLSPLEMISGKGEIKFISFREKYFPDYKTFSPIKFGTMLEIVEKLKKDNRRKIMELSGDERERVEIEQRNFEDYEAGEEENYSKKSYTQKKLDMVLVERFLMMDGKNTTNAKFPYLEEKISREEIMVIQNIRNKYGEGKINSEDLDHYYINCSKIDESLSVRNCDLVTIDMSDPENSNKCSIYDCGIVRIIGTESSENPPKVYVSGKIYSLFVVGYARIVFDDVSQISLNTMSSIYEDYPLYENFETYSDINKFFQSMNEHVILNEKDGEKITDYEIPYKRAVVKNIYYLSEIEDGWGSTLILNRHYE